jgi:hypothetical protein
MRALCLLLLGIASSVGSAATVGFEVASLGGNEYRYSYSFTGFTLAENEEIDIRFNPTLFGTLSNGVAPPDFDLLVLQPNTPPGAFGDYSLLALIDDPPMDGSFTIDVLYLGAGTPGAQPYFINQYDAMGTLTSSTAGGLTVSASAVPEPATSVLVGGAMLAVCLTRIRRSLR